MAYLALPSRPLVEPYQPMERLLSQLQFRVLFLALLVGIP